MKRYSQDPFWMTARFDSIDANGHQVRKGDRIFYYPKTKTVLSGAEAEQAAADFFACAEDEAFYNSQY